MEDRPTLKPHNWVFHLHATFVFVFSSLCYALVFFHRSAPAVLSKYISEDFGVPVDKLSIFSSMFFWTYACMQPFGGLLADIIDPALIVGVSAMIASCGSLICGLSKSLTLSVLGRFIVGFGAAPTYVPICKLITRWYPLSWYAVLGGTLLAVGGCGGIIAQAPLSAFAATYGWRAAFIGVACIGVIAGILVLVTVRLDPVKFGYESVNGDEVDTNEVFSFDKKMAQLIANFKSVVSKKAYYLFSAFCFCINGSYYNILGLWGGPYIRNTFPGFSDGKMLISLSVGMIVGSLAFPPISQLFGSRKWVLLSAALIATSLSASFLFFDLKMSFTLMFGIFLVWGACTGSISSVTFPMIIETYSGAVGATAIGCVNIFAFLGGAIFQSLTGSILKNYTKPTNGYTHKGYQIGLWIPVLVFAVIGLIITVFMEDKKKEPDAVQDHEEPHEESKDEEPIEI